MVKSVAYKDVPPTWPIMAHWTKVYIHVYMYTVYSMESHLFFDDHTHNMGCTETRHFVKLQQCNNIVGTFIFYELT